MARRVIALLGCPEVDEQESALDAITPGDLIELTTTGFRKNTADGEVVAAIFGLERDELGRDIDQPYAIGDKVKAGSFDPGDRVYAFLASGENVTKGQYLTGSTVAGALAASGGATDRVALALESVNSVADTTRIRAQIV